MSEQLPTVTRQDIEKALGEIGLVRGDLVIVHSSLKSFGRVEGGPEAVIDAALNVVGPKGTVVFPTFTGGRGFATGQKLDDVVYTGVITKTARKRDDFVKSFHPLYSICAKGPMAAELCEINDRYIFPSAQYKFLHIMGLRGGKAVLMGCDHNSNSSVHLIEEFGDFEYKIQDKPYWTLTVAAFLALPRERQKELLALHNGNNLPYTTKAAFNEVEPPMLKAGAIHITHVGNSKFRLMKIADLERIGLAEGKRDPWFIREKLDKPV
jgi:aminoglycoside 3-N-acetyltransferase